MSDKDKEQRTKTSADDEKPVVTHTPIIITDGSASLEFTPSAYTKDPDSNAHAANERLHLVSIVSDRPHTMGQADVTCFTFSGSDLYEIEIKCKAGGGFNDFTILGSFDPTISPVVNFDEGEYKENIVFPPRWPPTGHRFVSTSREITSFRVFRIVNGQRMQPPEHDCKLVATPGNGWTVDDAHAAIDGDAETEEPILDHELV